MAPPPFPLPPPLQAPAENLSTLDAIAGDIRVLRETTERQHLREVTGEDKKDQSSGWDKIPEIVQQMILKLSAVSEDILPPSPCETYLCILKQSKALGVAMVLNIEVSIRGCQVEVPTTQGTLEQTPYLSLTHFLFLTYLISMQQTWVCTIILS
jgi:hypothetical protein